MNISFVAQAYVRVYQKIFGKLEHKVYFEEHVFEIHK